MTRSQAIESAKNAITALEAQVQATRHLREVMSRVPPDQLSLTDLLAMRAGEPRNLETTENLLASHAKLLTAIVGYLSELGPQTAVGAPE